MVSDRHNEGFALIAVLCWTLVLGLVTCAIVNIAESQAIMSQSERLAAQNEARADAAINITIISLMDPAASGHPPTNGTPFVRSFLGHRIQLRVWDEQGKLDVNRASRGALLSLFERLGRPADEAQNAADQIVDWREQGDLKGGGGSKIADYRQARVDYGPRTGEFQSCGELALVIGVGSYKFSDLASAITIYSQESDVDIDVASDAALQLLRGTLPTGLASRQTTSGQSDADKASVGHAFTISARVEEGSYGLTRTAVIRLSGNPAKPLWIYRWE